MARWWPEIEELGLWTKPMMCEGSEDGDRSAEGYAEDADENGAAGWLSPRATVASLGVLAERCRRLKGLAVPLDISASSAASLAKGQTALERLTIGCSRQRSRWGCETNVDVDGLAKMLYEAFPGMKKLAFECPGTEDGSEEEEGLWKDVVDGYFALQQGAGVNCGTDEVA